ncbi:Uncharacterised protein [Grimontia hollisae]|uniref:Uncharacterized protein n=1 Tax=Grimontia hollisae TaxID=673 RepID=A0A377HP41_GRIHO|nr:Uncharacterised protein [Grimontia hollisae]STO57854.1 Uncharacterised protein [Grimontia hollisae]STQ76365.1 Uncharacterised protein [Grimontia hollisae]
MLGVLIYRGLQGVFGYQGLVVGACKGTVAAH